MTLVQKWSGRETRALRTALRLSVVAFAERLGVGQRTVSKWEAGGERIHPRPEMQAALDTLLRQAGDDERTRFDAIRHGAVPGIAATSNGHPTAEQSPDGLVVLFGDKWNHDTTRALADLFADGHELAPATAQRLAHEWRLVEPPQVSEMRAGRRVGTRLAEATIERADVLRRMDDFLGGGDMHDLVRRELQVTLELVRGASYSEATGRSLLSAIGELAQLAGWVASDAGLHQQAERYYLGGVSAAHAAGDEPLAGNLLSSLSYQVANVGDPREGVLLASSAYNGAAATATATAMLLERLAWANARFGDPDATQRTLDAVDDAFAASNPADDPAWAYWLNRDEIDVMAGRCYTELRRPEPAIPLLRRAVDRYDETHARELALYLSWLAEAHVYAGNIEQAADDAGRALHLSMSVTSARSLERVRLVRQLLVPYHDTTAVDDFEEAARQLDEPSR